MSSQLPASNIPFIEIDCIERGLSCPHQRYIMHNEQVEREEVLCFCDHARIVTYSHNQEHTPFPSIIPGTGALLFRQMPMREYQQVAVED
jgi:hypothetical protein